jgi:hypothetical protein
MAGFDTPEDEVVGHALEAVVNRIHKTLEQCNIKLSSVASDIMGVSGRQMLRALIEGETDAEKLADKARGSLRAEAG